MNSISIEQRAPGGDVVSNKVAAGVPVRMVADPPALLSRVARDDTDDGRAIIRISPVPFALVGAQPGWICRVRVRRTLFPRRFGTARRPRRPPHASQRSGRSRPGGLKSAAAGYEAVCVTAPARVGGGPSVRPWQSRGAAAPASPVAAVSSRRRSSSAGYSSPHRPDSGRPENALGHGICAVRSAHSVDIRAHAGGGDVPTTGCKCYRPGAQRSASQS
jgi:hypothetical protein